VTGKMPIMHTSPIKQCSEQNVDNKQATKTKPNQTTKLRHLYVAMSTQILATHYRISTGLICTSE